MIKTPEQLKGAIRNMAKEKGIHAQEVLQIFMFERIIERLSVSPYKDRFILKGGLLISAILGVAERTTMDMDTTVKGLLDITTGDEITPKEIQFSYPFLFDDRRVMVKAYTQETIMAEKYETILRRNIGNTRARDFYDLHLLYRLYRENADWNLLKQAILATAKKRDSLYVLQDTKRILQALEESTVLQDLWKRYQAQNLYAREITYPAIMETVKEFTENMNF